MLLYYILYIVGLVTLPLFILYIVGLVTLPLFILYIIYCWVGWLVLILYYKISKVGYDTNKYFITGALTHIKCKQAFKDWCLADPDAIDLPIAMGSGGSGRWEIVD